MKWYGILALLFMISILGGLVYVGNNTDKFYEKSQVFDEVVDVNLPKEKIEKKSTEPKIVTEEIKEKVEPTIVETKISEPIEEFIPSNDDICLAIVGKLFTNLNPTEEELADLEKELKENNCGD